MDQHTLLEELETSAEDALVADKKQSSSEMSPVVVCFKWCDLWTELDATANDTVRLNGLRTSDLEKIVSGVCLTKVGSKWAACLSTEVIGERV